MTKITLEIKSCKECPFFDEKRHYTDDSWELAHDWFCKASDNKKIAGYVGWSEEKDVEIPNWCPVKADKNKPKEHKINIEKIQTFLSKQEFIDDSWPNYVGWVRAYPLFNMLIDFSYANNTFSVSVCESGCKSASKATFIPILNDVTFVNLQKFLVKFNSINGNY